MSSDSSDSEGTANGKRSRPKTDYDEGAIDDHYKGIRGPRTPGSPDSPHSRSISRSSSKSHSLSRSPAGPRSPLEPSVGPRSPPGSPRSPLGSPRSSLEDPRSPRKGPRSPPEDLDDDGRSNISSGSSIPSETSLKDDKEPTKAFENGKSKSPPASKNHFQVPNADDLSDVSDIDDSDGLADEEKDDDFGRSNGIGKRLPEATKPRLETVRSKDRDRFERDQRSSLNLDDGEQLDFEAEDQPEVEKEDGELEAVPERREKVTKEATDSGDKSADEGEVKEEGAESLEEGEVSDEGDPKPEKPPICRFYSRGACTWGSNCRFLHPGVTDKGNYSMFDMARPMVASANGMGIYPPEPRPYPIAAPARSIAAPYGPAVRRDDPAAVESAWERGLRQAKEMMRKSTKRKETDMDFEEKKMNLSIGQEEMDKENDYYTRAASPLDEPEGWSRISPMIEPEHRRSAVRVVERYEDIIPDPMSPAMYERYEYRRGYEKLRDPEHILRREKKYYDEEEIMARKANKKMVREVIVQRVERSKRLAADAGRRPDEWADPWMRSKSPGRKGHRSRKVSYSSGSSSYSGSSSRSSSNSSYSSYSPSRSRSGSRSQSRSLSGSRSPTSRIRRPRSPPAGIPIRPKLFPDGKDAKLRALKSGPALEKAAADRPLMMNPPAPMPRRPIGRPLSPSAMRKVCLNPPPPAPKSRPSGKHGKGGRSRGRKSSSESGSSGSSSESSHSSYSSSSSSPGSPPGRAMKKIEPDERLAAATLKSKGVDALKVAGQKPQIKLTLKPSDGKREKLTAPPPVAGKKRPIEDPVSVDAPGASSPKSAGAKKTTSRREELLKQLKAVEDAIARKRLKI